MDSRKLLGLLKRLVQLIDVQVTISFTLLVTVVVFCAIVFENRDSIFTSVVQTTRSNHTATQWQLSPASIERVLQLHNQIGADYLVVKRIDARANRKQLLLESAIDESLSKLLVANPLVRNSVFDNNAHNTEHMVYVLGNEFRCVDVSTTSFARRIGGNGGLTTMCYQPLPPIYGNVKGYLAAGFKHPLAYREFEQVRHELAHLATRIYLDDINPKTEQ